MSDSSRPDSSKLDSSTSNSSQAGRDLATQRKLKPGHCKVCGKAFTTLANRAYCSNACRQKAKYQRKVAAKKQLVLDGNGSVWDFIEQLATDIPESELDKLPSDFSRNLDHYLYSAPKSDG